MTNSMKLKSNHHMNRQYMFVRRLKWFAAVLIITLCGAGCFADTKSCRPVSTIKQEDVPHEILEEARSFNVSNVYPRLDSMGISLSQEKIDEIYVIQISNSKNVFEIRKYPYGIIYLDSTSLTVVHGRRSPSMNVSYLDYLLKPHFTVVSELKLDSMIVEREAVACGAYGFAMFRGENVYLYDDGRWFTLSHMFTR